MIVARQPLITTKPTWGTSTMSFVPGLQCHDRSLALLLKRPVHSDCSHEPGLSEARNSPVHRVATVLPCGLLVAQSSLLQDMGSRFQAGGHTVSWVHIMLLAATAVAVVGLAALFARRISIREGQGFRSSRKLFRDLCRTHDLNWPTRRLLRQLAAAHNLPQPAELFVRPNCFQSEWVEQLPQPVREHVFELRHRLFD